MRAFSFVVRAENGVHARPAGLLAKTAKCFNSTVKVSSAERCGNGKSIIEIMSMDLRHGDTLCFEVDGEDEDAAIIALEQFVFNNL